MDWLTAGAAAATIIGVIFGVLFNFQRSKKKDAAPTVVRKSRADIKIRNLNLYTDAYSNQEYQDPEAPNLQAPASANLPQNRFSQVATLNESLLKYRVSTQTDSLSQPPHTNQAEQDLSQILLLRSFNPPKAQQEIQDLWCRISDRGDLSAASSAIKTRVIYWAARLCSASPDTLDLARHLRSELHNLDPDTDLSIVDVLLAAADRDNDTALRLIRDSDNPDSRAVLFHLLVRMRTEQDAIDWYAHNNATGNRHFFTNIGWTNWALCMAKAGDWQNAAQQLATLQVPLQDAPALAFIEARINAAMLVPDDFRISALQAVPVYPHAKPNLGPEAEQYHAHATLCFQYVEQHLNTINDVDFTRFIADWRLWLRLMNPNIDATGLARQEITQTMESGSQAVNLMLFAWAFNISFNPEPLKQHLKQRQTLGGLDKRERLAEFLLCDQSLSPRERSHYLEKHQESLGKIVSPAALKGMYIEALLDDNQIEKARTILSRHHEDLDKEDVDRLTIMIDTHEGDDPRPNLELLYRQTGNFIDLRNLVVHLTDVNDRRALLPYAKELFERQKTVDNARRVVMSYDRSASIDYKSIITFLDGNPHIVEQSDHLKEAKAVAYFHAGQLQESRELNDVLLSCRTNHNDFLLDARIAMASGDWERIAAVIDREWPRRNSLSPETLITLAQLAGQQSENAERALRFATLAAEQAPDNPQILAAAYSLHFQLGRDDQANPDWLMRAHARSSPDEGPLWSVSLQDLVADIPKRRNYLSEVERKWLHGEIPMSLAAGPFNVSMARLLLHISRNNAKQLDGRSRTMLPVITGGRNPVELQSEWTIGLDVSSIMILAYLNFLGDTLAAFHHIKFAPDVMEFLFLERDHVRFHQPSRISAAKQLQKLQNSGQIQAAQISLSSPQAIAEEVGHELATLLHMARRDNGKVICVLPIHKVGSLTEQQADTSQYDDLIHSPMDFCKLLSDTGRIGTVDHQRAELFLTSQGQTEGEGLSPAAFDGPIYIDGLAISYLTYAKIVQPMASVGLDIRIHPDVFREAYAFIDEEHTSAHLKAQIDGIRDLLRDAIDSGAASFLPRSGDQDERIRSHDFRLQSTAFLLAGSASCNALCIDDRYVNSHLVVTDSTKKSVPIVCVMDVLRHLRSQQQIDILQYWTAAHNLRQGGFVFIPVESDELAYWLKAAQINNGHFTESVELRVLRQTMARADALALANPNEAITLTGNLTTACGKAIVSLWTDESLKSQTAATLSLWVWRNLLATAVLGHQHLAQDAYANWIREMISSSLAGLFVPAPFQSTERRAHYAQWLERSLLHPLRPANHTMIDKALSSALQAISHFQDDQHVLGNRFLKQLPESSRTWVIEKDPDFATLCGIEKNHIFQIGSDIQLPSHDFFAAARAVLRTNNEAFLNDISGKKVSITFDKHETNIIVTWPDKDGAPHRTSIPELALLSPIPETRIGELSNIIERLGPTVPHFSDLLHILESRELNAQELFALFNESANGLAALQTRMTQKLEIGSSIDVIDIVPQSISYFEQFCGPLPTTHNPESYFFDVLIPYRKALLNRNVRIALDIGCLGALRDDLLPGQYTAAIDGDAIWLALSSGHMTNNPFSLLGSLDVALYRQVDRRFREYSAETVDRLLDLDQSAAQEDRFHLYNLLSIFADFVLHRINLMENVPPSPSYWKRMCAWMQAGLITRTLAASASPVNIDSLDKFIHENMTPASVYAELVDARTEPMLFSGRIQPAVLQKEILSRLQILRLRHESEGRQVPRSDDIDDALARVAHHNETFTLAFPGPLEGHKRPTEAILQEYSDELAEISKKDAASFPWQSLVAFSQFVALGEIELDLARQAVQAITDNTGDPNLHEKLNDLNLASIVAAAARDTKLADSIADAIVSFASQYAEEQEIHIMLQITLQTAAAYETEDAWFKWLEARLADIALHLPPPPNKALQIFLDHLDEIGKVIPTELWFHLRARSIASAGAG